MDSYITHLKNLINIERNFKRQEMLDEIKDLTAKERERKGRAVNDLKGRFIKKEFNKNIIQFSRVKDIKTEINIGDQVKISKGNPLRSDLTGTVIKKKLKSISVAFDGNMPEWVFNSKIRMDLSVNDVTFARMENNLKNLNKYGRNAIKLICQNIRYGPPKISNDINYDDTQLNQFQKEAITKSLHTEDFFLIHGPFGTGKTKTLIELIYQEVKKGNKVLVTAESNVAVDNIVERLTKMHDLNITRLGQPQKVSKDVMSQTVMNKLEKHKSYSKIERITKEIDRLSKNLDKNKSKPKSKSEKKFLIKEIRRKNRIIRKTEKIIIEDIIKESQVILTTNSSAARDELSDIEFDVAIIDEASQTTIPSILIPIAKAKRFIMAGDHKQLPPIVSKAKELEHTLFEKFIKKYPNKKQLLNVQYRMNEKLMKFPNSEFYNDELICDEDVKDNIIDNIPNDPYLSSPLVFIDTSKHPKCKETKIKYSKSFINNLEAELALKIVNGYLDLGIDKKDIGIISPYSDQVNLIGNETDVEVKTVDGFQGGEKEIIIISTVRSNEKGKIGFLKDLRRLNVAITRAMKKLIIIGNAETLSHNETYKRLIDNCRSEGDITEFTSELKEFDSEKN